VFCCLFLTHTCNFKKWKVSLACITRWLEPILTFPTFSGLVGSSHRPKLWLPFAYLARIHSRGFPQMLFWVAPAPTRRLPILCPCVFGSVATKISAVDWSFAEHSGTEQVRQPGTNLTWTTHLTFHLCKVFRPPMYNCKMARLTPKETLPSILQSTNDLLMWLSEGSTLCATVSFAKLWRTCCAARTWVSVPCMRTARHHETTTGICACNGISAPTMHQPTKQHKKSCNMRKSSICHWLMGDSSAKYCTFYNQIWLWERSRTLNTSWVPILQFLQHNPRWRHRADATETEKRRSICRNIPATKT